MHVFILYKKDVWVHNTHSLGTTIAGIETDRYGKSTISPVLVPGVLQQLHFWWGYGPDFMIMIIELGAMIFLWQRLMTSHRKVYKLVIHSSPHLGWTMLEKNPRRNKIKKNTKKPTRNSIRAISELLFAKYMSTRTNGKPSYIRASQTLV